MADKIRVLLNEEEVDKRIKEVADQINKDYEGKAVHLICILKGGVFFTCELAKRLTVPVTLDFMSVSSYGSGTESSGVVKIIKDLDQPLEGRNVLIVGILSIPDAHLRTSSIFYTREIRTPSTYAPCLTSRSAA